MGRLLAGILLSLSFAAFLSTGSGTKLNCMEEVTWTGESTVASKVTPCDDAVTHCKQILEAADKVKRGCGKCGDKETHCTDCLGEKCNDGTYLGSTEQFKCNTASEICAKNHCKLKLTVSSGTATTAQGCGQCETGDGKHCRHCSAIRGTKKCNDVTNYLLRCYEEDATNLKTNTPKSVKICGAGVSTCHETLTTTSTKRGCGACALNTIGCTPCDTGDLCNNGTSIIPTTPAPTPAQITPTIKGGEGGTKTGGATQAPQGGTSTTKTGAVVRASPTLAVLLAALTCLATLL